MSPTSYLTGPIWQHLSRVMNVLRMAVFCPEPVGALARPPWPGRGVKMGPLGSGWGQKSFLRLVVVALLARPFPDRYA
jgi:hypothetical protein